MRVRGLKPKINASIKIFKIVAPRAGAWIETYPLDNAKRPIHVAPRAGAWIET